MMIDLRRWKHHYEGTPEALNGARFQADALILAQCQGRRDPVSQDVNRRAFANDTARDHRFFHF